MKFEYNIDQNRYIIEHEDYKGILGIKFDLDNETISLIMDVHHNGIWVAAIRSKIPIMVDSFSKIEEATILMLNSTIIHLESKNLIKTL